MAGRQSASFFLLSHQDLYEGFILFLAAVFIVVFAEPTGAMWNVQNHAGLARLASEALCE
jgi:hypothetical protein